MGKAVGYVMGVKPREGNANRGRKAAGGNRRERKLKADMKELRQNIARTGNELYRRKQQRKASAKEKKILKDLKTKMNNKDVTSRNLRTAKEQWIDKLRYKKVKLEKFVEKRKRKQDNFMFHHDQKGFFWTLEADITREGEMPDMDKFVEFWGGIWEQNERTPNMPWMEQVKRELQEKVGVVSELHANNDIVPEWWPSGRTVLLPKSKALTDEKNYRPITCLNTSYKILTGLIAKFMRDHTIANEIWDKGQLGAVEGVLGTVDQLIIDRCITEEVKQYHRNLAVAFYDYKKAYDKVHHDWMTRVYEWIGIPKNVIQLIDKLMGKWKTRLEIWNGGEKMTSRWIRVLCGFLQGHSYSPVGFSISEIPVCILLQKSRGYRMGEPGKRMSSRTHSLFVDDLKVYQESHKALKDVNEIIVQASHDTGACYGVAKCAEIVFEHGKMVRGEGLKVLEERMKTIDPDENEIYKFLGLEQADGIKAEAVFERIKSEISKRVKLLTKTELNDANLIQAINKKVIPVSTSELNELDQVIKRELRQKNMLGRQASDERLYLKRAKGGRGLKSLRDTYKETRLRVACYMVKSANPWIKAAWRREMLKEENTIIVESVRTMEEVGVRMRFEGNSVQLDDELIENDWRPTWKKVKSKLQEGVERKRVEAYEIKEQQGRLFREQEEECNLWLTQNVNPRRTASVMVMLSPFSTRRICSRDAKRKQEFSNVIGWGKSSLLRQPITLLNSCFRFASREQIRLVENGL